MTEAVEEALKIKDAGLNRHGIELKRDFQGAPVISADRHKLLQILVNLIGNAKYAVSNSGQESKVIQISIETDEDRVCVSIEDNGVGIAKENLAKIFNHGFTTKGDEGHGFGLHSCALTAAELDGSLTGYSAGEGQGARFVLSLPLKKDAACLK